MSGPTPTNHDLVDAVEEVLTATLELVRTLTPGQGELPTGCPGWTVHDNLAHMVGLETVMSGTPDPKVEIPPYEHVKNKTGRYMERHVQMRRALPLQAVTDELAGLLPRRIGQLRALAAQGDPEVPGPFGVQALSRSLPIRVFDLWAHEQDIRRAVGLEPRCEGRSGAIVLSQVLRGWSGGLPGSVTGVDGQLVVEVTGPEPSSATVSLGSGGPATATLRGNAEQLAAAYCGRGEPDPGLLSGDPALVAALSGHLAMTP
jgi:uncharacterized protein (TIGR03083 family)